MARMTRSSSHKYRRRIAFAETDAAGFAHFSALLNLVEEAEHDFLRTIGVSVLSPTEGWPRLGLRAEFFTPTHFGDMVEVRIAPASAGRSSITWRFEIRQVSNKAMIASGEMTVCHVTMGRRRGKGSTAKWSASPIPKALRDLVPRSPSPEVTA